MSHQPKKTRRPIQFPHLYMPKYTVPLRYLCLTIWRYAYVVCRYVCWHISSKRWILQFLADQPPKLWTAGTDDGSPLKKQFDINIASNLRTFCVQSLETPAPPVRPPVGELEAPLCWERLPGKQCKRLTSPKEIPRRRCFCCCGLHPKSKDALVVLSISNWIFGMCKTCLKKNVYKYKVASFNCQKTHRDSGIKKGSDGSAIPLVQKTVKPRIWPEQVSVRAIHSQKYKKSLRNLNHFG